MGQNEPKLWIRPLLLCHYELACKQDNTVVSRIYAPRFATLALVESIGGGLICGIWHFISQTPLPVPRLDVGIRTLYYRPFPAWRKMVWERHSPICHCFSCPPETRWSRSTDRGWPQCRGRRFPSSTRICPFNVLYSIDTSCGHTCDRRWIP